LSACTAYWQKFNAYLNDGGLEAISWWAAEYVKDPRHVVQAGEHAPDSEAKDLSVFASMSDGERLIHDFGEDLAESSSANVPRCVVRLDKLRDWLAHKTRALNHDKYGEDGRKFLETPETVARILKKIKGLQISQRQFKAGGERFRVVANFEVSEEARWPELEPLCKRPEEAETM
jgi:hypothetical protein